MLYYSSIINLPIHPILSLLYIDSRRMLAISPSEASHSPAIGDSVVETNDATSLKAWTSFLQEYARGDGPANPPRPPLTSSLLQRFEAVVNSNAQVSFEDAPLYTSTTVTPELARTIRDFYCDNGYLPPPRAPWEERRERCIQEHDLYSDKQHKHIQNVTDILSAFFPDALITFSLFQDRVQTHFALSGPEEVIKGFKLHVGLRIPAEDSLCGHAVLLDRTMLFVPDLEADWRYRRNPFGVAGFKSYVGVPVALELDPLQDDVPVADYMGPRRGRIAIGTINICFTKQKVYELSPGQQLTVDKMTSMLEAQLRSTWEGDHRRRDGRARTELSKYIGETKFVEASRTPGTINHQIYDESRRELMTCDLIKSLAEKVSTIISEADTVDVFDIRAVSLVQLLGYEADVCSSRTYLRTPSTLITRGTHYDHSRAPSSRSNSRPMLSSLFSRQMVKSLTTINTPGSSLAFLPIPRDTWLLPWPMVTNHSISSSSHHQAPDTSSQSPTSTLFVI